MYLRHSTIKKNGKTHTYWRLVKSERVGNKVLGPQARTEIRAHFADVGLVVRENRGRERFKVTPRGEVQR